MDLALEQKRAKQFYLAKSADGNEMFPCLRTTLSRTVGNNLKRTTKNDKMVKEKTRN